MITTGSFIKEEHPSENINYERTAIFGDDLTKELAKTCNTAVLIVIGNCEGSSRRCPKKQSRRKQPTTQIKDKNTGGQTEQQRQ